MVERCWVVFLAESSDLVAMAREASMEEDDEEELEEEEVEEVMKGEEVFGLPSKGTTRCEVEEEEEEDCW